MDDRGLADQSTEPKDVDAALSSRDRRSLIDLALRQEFRAFTKPGFMAGPGQATNAGTPDTTRTSQHQ